MCDRYKYSSIRNTRRENDAGDYALTPLRRDPREGNLKSIAFLYTGDYALTPLRRDPQEGNLKSIAFLYAGDYALTPLRRDPREGSLQRQCKPAARVFLFSSHPYQSKL